MAAKDPDEPECSDSRRKRLPLESMADQTAPAEYLEEHIIISNNTAEEIRDAFERGSLVDAVSKVMENLKALESARLNIAVTGDSGSGKSTFVNAIRGLGDEDEGSDPTGVIETTMVPTAYKHPQRPDVILWDLPGIDTPNFQAATYLEQVQFSRYDFFILIASERFKSSHAELAREIRRMGKSFYFVRAKINLDLQASKTRRSQTYNEEVILTQIRQNCQQCLEAEGVASPQVFLLSSWELGKYDFMLLQETLERELPCHKRNAFLLALPNISVAILQKKKSALEGQIWKMATLSCAAAVLPIPGLSIPCDVGILMKSLSSYRHDFGLDEESLNRLAKKVGKPVEDLKEAIKSPLAKEISNDMVVKMLIRAGGKVTQLKLVSQFSKLIPVIGSLAAGGIAFVTTYHMLSSSLNEIAEDAQNVIIRAFEPTVCRLTMA